MTEGELKKRIAKKIRYGLQSDSNWVWEEIVGLVTDEAKTEFKFNFVCVFHGDEDYPENIQLLPLDPIYYKDLVKKDDGYYKGNIKYVPYIEPFSGGKAFLKWFGSEDTT